MKGEIILHSGITISFWPKGKLKQDHFSEDAIMSGWPIHNATLVPAPGEYVQIGRSGSRGIVAGYAYNRSWEYWQESSQINVDIDLWETRAEYEAQRGRE